MNTPSVFNWSGGKDSALCLHHVLQTDTYSVQKLLTTLSGETQRVSMHGVRQELLQQQALQIGLPLQQVFLPENASMEAYNALMAQTMRAQRQQGITHAIFGDINLEDLRQYREAQLAEVGMQAVFPLWNRPTGELVLEFLDLGFRAVVVCVNERVLDASFAGRPFDADFLHDLPANVDPAGENGEFHTFVFDGPIFREPVRYTLGESVRRTYTPATDADDNCFKQDDKPVYDNAFWFRDLLPL
ncbi:diphthine--ammonia ligase [Pontibacter sp. E15-1]|uniref:Dph6-related ATP pyrophosphatase n=1 Tax=Pontibacter sp. E15-1 TaxID=2919918 RepID=UPI001F4FEB19|nr:diphthine--ammonia ligase [Pontibacter sp. E15-1]MCJ8164652.1 diphthine--ammonia ligase [Pontibacter sp. E15-1]